MFAIRMKGHRTELPLAAAQGNGPQQRAGREFPQSQRSIIRSGGEQSAAGRKRDRGDNIRMT